MSTGVERDSVVAGVRTAEALADAFLRWSPGDPRPWPVRFRAWADSLDLDARVERETKIVVIRWRSFGKPRRRR